MSIVNEIERIKNNIASAYNEIESKGGTIPQTPNSSNLAGAVDSISVTPAYDFAHPRDLFFNLNKELADLIPQGYAEAINNYSALSNEPTNIYIPEAGYTRYAIHKRSSGKYRILYFKESSPRMLTTTGTKILPAFIYFNTPPDSNYYSTKTINGIYYNSLYVLALSDSTGVSFDKVYTSSEFSTIQDCINQITTRLPQGTYSQTDYIGFVPTDTIIPLTNGIFFNPNTNDILPNMTRISSKETYIIP